MAVAGSSCGIAVPQIRVPMSLKPNPESKKKFGPATRLVHAGRDPSEQHGFVNTPIYRGSTVLFPTYDDLQHRRVRYTYGTHGTPTSDALAEAWSEIAGAAGTVATPSGLAALSIGLMAAVSAGDHLLVTDSAYRPTRIFCDEVLKRFGVETTFPPHERGVDIAVEAGTKYLSGGSDLLLGLTSANARYWPALNRTYHQFSVCAGPEDMFLAMRGLRTMGLRLREHGRQGLEIARWLHGRLELFGMGFSWGGFESLCIPFDCTPFRTATRWAPGGPGLRFHIGLEDVEDLKTDLAAGFTRLRKAAGDI